MPAWLFSLFYSKFLCSLGPFAALCFFQMLLKKVTECGPPPWKQGMDKRTSPQSRLWTSHASGSEYLLGIPGWSDFSRVSFLAIFFLSLFYLKEMLTMATSKQIPNQPSYLGTIQEVTVLCLASLCEPMCPSPKPGNYIWHLWEEMSCLSHETCSAEVSRPTSASSEASLTAPARAQLNLGGEACSGVHGSLSMDPSPPVRARASWKSCPWSHL